MHKKIELLANVAIIALALTLGGVMTKRYLMRDSRAQVKPGMRLSLPEIDWTKNDQTLLLVLSTNCGYCTKSAPFYQQLVRQTVNDGKVGLVAVLPQSVDEGKKYLAELNIQVSNVRQATPALLGVAGTPSLILADNTGTVKNVWVGMVPGEKEVEILSQLRATCGGSQPCS